MGEISSNFQSRDGRIVGRTGKLEGAADDGYSAVETFEVVSSESRKNRDEVSKEGRVFDIQHTARCC